MANFLINSPGLTTTGTDAGELFLLQSAAVSASTVVAKAGNDTISMLEGVASADKVSVVGEGGADLITVSSTIFDEKSVFNGGAGGDTVKFHGGGSKGNINLGAGSDLLLATAATHLNSVTFGAGADRLTAGFALSAAGASFLMGSGADTIDLSVQGGGGKFNSAQLAGGGGADVITISADDENNSALSILGGAGGDTINFDLDDSQVVIKGGKGSDVITQDASELNDSSQVLGGAGADSITIFDMSAGAGANNLVGGGAGKDTIFLSREAVSAADISIMGGGGDDSISIGTIEANISAGTIFGGAGADSITFSASVLTDTGISTQIGISNFTDSTLSATDLVTFDQTGGATTTGATLDFVTDGLGTNLAAGGTLANTEITVGGSIITKFTATLTDLTARVGAIDALATSKGTVVAFMDTGADTGSAAYLFIQGGATDTLVEINEIGALSGITTVTVANSSVSIAFNGN